MRAVGGALGGSQEGGRGRSTGAPGCRGIVAAAVRLRAPAVVLQAVVDLGEARLVGRVRRSRTATAGPPAPCSPRRPPCTAGLARSLDLSLMQGLDAVCVSVHVALTWGGNGYVGGGARSSPRPAAWRSGGWREQQQPRRRHLEHPSSGTPPAVSP